MADFVHLHCHSQYSLRDGVASVEDLVIAAKNTGMTAIALTDHGNLFGLIPFYKKCRKEKIQPIIGIETYMAPQGIKNYNTSENIEAVEKILSRHLPKNKRYRLKSISGKGRQKNNHLVLLAMNELGYQNLIKLVSIGYIKGFKWVPRIDIDILRDHTEGLIASSACIGGEIGRLLINNDFDAALESVNIYLEMFDGRFYLEMMPHNPYNAMLIELAKQSGAELIATRRLQPRN